MKLRNENKEKWLKFDKQSDKKPLITLLEEKNNLGYNPNIIIDELLNNGDIYCYRTADEKWITTASIIIKTKGKHLIEKISSQTFDTPVSKELLSVLKRKIKKEKNFLNKHKYLKAIDNEKRLEKLLNKKHYTKSDLRFLYQIDEKIETICDSKEEKIRHCLEGRSMRKDLIKIFGCQPTELAIGMSEFSNQTKYLYGDLDLKEVYNGENINLPKVVIGNLDLTGLSATKNIKLPEFIRGNLDLRNVIESEYLDLPYYVGGSVRLDSLEKVKALNLPYIVKGDLNLSSLKTYFGLKLPEFISGGLNLSSLTSAKHLRFPKYIGTDILLGSITSLDDLKLPKKVAGTLDLSSLRTLKGRLPDVVAKDLYLSNLTEVNGLYFPESVDGSLDLSHVLKANYVMLPKYIGKDLKLTKLKSAQNVVFPDYVGNDLELDSLETAKDLALPQVVEGRTYLNKLQEYDNLVLPERSDYIVLSSLKEAKKPLYVNNIKVFDAFDLVDISGLKLSKEMTEDRFFVPGTTLDEITYNFEQYCEKPKVKTKRR